jgi:hypothetical protein
MGDTRRNTIVSFTNDIPTGICEHAAHLTLDTRCSCREQVCNAKHYQIKWRPHR